MPTLNDAKAIVDIFKAAYQTLSDFTKWADLMNKEYDFFGFAAQRYKDQLEERYNVIRILGMNKPVKLRSIFTRVNILEKITNIHRVTIGELEHYFDRDRRGFGIKRETKPGIEVVNNETKLIVLGKPGAGKTTFLKYITLQAADGLVKESRIPIFINLKDLSDSEKSIIDFIIEQFDICNFPEANLFLERMLQLGKCILLLDGLDEVSKDREDDIIKGIRDISEKYNKNQFILSCRIAAYSYCFEKFTDVEIADFNDKQIVNFINSWFGDQTLKAKACWRELKANPPIKELASAPLLLTLLCLAFDEIMSFPKNRAELYKEAVDALLRKWDASRSIKRDDVYKALSLKRKESLLSFIAEKTFEKGQYFIQQQKLESYIAEFIQNLPSIKEETIEMDSGSILKAIESQHGLFVERAKGIYSFSHLTIQEYFTAKYHVDNAMHWSLRTLVNNHLIDDKWREVFLLTTGMLDNADDFLLFIKDKINEIANNEPTIIDLLKFINDMTLRQKSMFETRKITIGAARALAFAFAIAQDHERAHSLDESRTLAISYGLTRAVNEAHIKDISPERVRALDSALIASLDIARALNTNDEFAKYLDLAYSMANESKINENQISLDKIYETEISQNPKLERERNRIIERLRLINSYLKSNLLLIDCLNTECYITKTNRQKILDEILAIPEIK